jgi:hypothetical protein
LGHKSWFGTWLTCGSNAWLAAINNAGENLPYTPYAVQLVQQITFVNECVPITYVTKSIITRTKTIHAMNKGMMIRFPSVTKSPLPPLTKPGSTPTSTTSRNC